MTSQGTTTELSNNCNIPLDLHWLYPVHFTNVYRLDPEYNEIFHRSLRLPVRPEIFESDQQRHSFEEGYQSNKSQWVVMCLNFIAEQELLKHDWRLPVSVSNRHIGFIEYGTIPKARFSESGHRITAFKSIEDVNNNQEVLTDEYKSAPIEAKIYVKPHSVSCRYAIMSEQEDGREILRIAASIKIPEKSVCVDFIRRNFLVSDEKVMAVLQ